jgi:hypothetical protein
MKGLFRGWDTDDIIAFTILILMCSTLPLAVIGGFAFGDYSSAERLLDDRPYHPSAVCASCLAVVLLDHIPQGSITILLLTIIYHL